MSQEIMIKGEKCTLREGKTENAKRNLLRKMEGGGEGREKKTFRETSAACVAYFVALQRKHEKRAKGKGKHCEISAPSKRKKLIFNVPHRKGNSRISFFLRLRCKMLSLCILTARIINRCSLFPCLQRIPLKNLRNIMYVEEETPTSNFLCANKFSISVLKFAIYFTAKLISPLSQHFAPL